MLELSKRNELLAIVLLYALIAPLCSVFVHAQDSEDRNESIVEESTENDAPLIYVIPFQGEVEPALRVFLMRGLLEARAYNASAIVIEMHTPGGRVDAALDIADMFMDEEIPVVIYVNREATSAGAIISLAADSIYMHERGQIGTAAPVLVGGGEDDTMSEKALSYVLAKVRSICEAQGFDERKTQIALAMVDRDVEIEDVTERGKLLTLTAQQAFELDFIAGVVENRQEVIEALGFMNAEIVEIQATYSELLARFLSSMAVSSLLLSVAFICIFIEIRTPGIGLAGGLGAVCLILFFFGHTLAGLAGWESIVLFMLGITLLGVELFLLPGFGLAGAAGVLFVIGSIVLALLETSPTSPHFFELVTWDDVAHASLMTLFSMTLGMIGAMLIPLLFPLMLNNRSVASWLMLSEVEDREMGYQSADEELQEFNGLQGLARTPLRPTGVAEIEGKRVEVVSLGGFIPAYTPIVVVKVEGRRVIVRPT